jgi:SpoVK/Ycf46/Vps4 family AAA+-type ATPase
MLTSTRYFHGVLFLTTNRVQTFDPAFQSRIHLSLHYYDLSRDAREQLWSAFLQKTRHKGHGLQDLTPAEIRKLSKRHMNGRQIKNVVKLAATLADHENAALTFDHLVRTMSVADAYTVEGWFSYAKGLLGYIGF